ncbi:ankyrin repeat-containing protein [Panicum miliaceum]|uniref:Ankyrin repeat-containing protein n=1 Tax=Panicum miliaceum TaxID=4540 RepID=A0A3L6PLV6_PANMI|nr:ankyrin repeat-containing protein [Panicum miliaceum]
MDPALYKAATRGNVARLTELLVDPEDPRTPQLHTALHLAALHGHADFAREVLDKNGELLVARNCDGDTPLHLAAKAGKLEKGNTPLHEAVRHHRIPMALAVLDGDPSRAYDLNERMESPLHMAAREGLVQVVQKMLDYSWVDQEFLPSSSLNGTPLHQAVLGGHLTASSDRPDRLQRRQRPAPRAQNHRRVVEMLLNKRAELAYKRNSRSESPLHIAVRNGSTDAIKALLRHCPDAAEMVNGQGWNAFHVSVASGKTSALRCLLRHIHPPELLNYADSDGDTPLHLAANMGHVRSALLLLDDQRVNPCIRDRRGHTARSLLETKFLAGGELHPDEMYLLEQLEKHESKRCRKDQVPPVILSARRRPLNDKDFDKVVDAYFIAATLIATVTFAVTFTMPGGYDQTRGIALHGRNAAFMTFVVSNTVAMCSSIVVIFLLIWARQEPVKLRIHNVMWSQTLTIVACLAMLVALMTAVYITVAPNCSVACLRRHSHRHL